MPRLALTRTRAALLAVGVTLVGGGLFSLAPGPATASSHREAPLISGQPQYDNTDVYAFVSPDRPDTTTLIANWIPFEDPSGGPNFYKFATDARFDGPTLRARLAGEGALPHGALQSLAVGVAAALTAIHAAGLVHRDLKPSNVILSITGPRVIDFGISRSLDATAELTANGVVLGTPGRLAPERLLGDVADPSADVFTWGCLVAYAGLNRHPYGTGDALAMAGRAIHGEPDLDGLPATLATVVRTALDKNPAARPTARELLLTLTGGGPADPVTTRLDLPPAPPDEAAPTSVLEPHGRGPGRRLALGALAFAIGVALLVTGVLLLRP